MDEKRRETIAEAAKEKFFDRYALAQEISLACKDYFVAEVHLVGNVVNMVFPNGQHFTLTVK